MNGPEGLEHGFTVEDRPDGGGALAFEIEAAGARTSLAGDAVRLRAEGGASLRYGKLAVWDAEGVLLASHFEVPVPEHIRLLVDDADAVYPLTIDPLLTGVADAALESDQAASLAGAATARRL